ncbi:hypothetical protein SH611_05685 [Geminicoccaceae bacterium 1502E]|nr:hypothetical protein [Geminicoccaceae bacterium 1502E]
MNITGRLGSLLGLLLLAGFVGLILVKVPELPLIVICGAVLVMVAWHAIEEEWLGDRRD